MQREFNAERSMRGPQGQRLEGLLVFVERLQQLRKLRGRHWMP